MTTRALLAGSFAEVRLPRRPAIYGIGVSGLGEVQLGDTLVTSGQVLAAMSDVHQHVMHLQADVQRAIPDLAQVADGQSFVGDWGNFFGRWGNFYATHQGTLASGPAYLTGATVAALRNLASEYNDYERRYSELTGLDPTYNPAPPSNNSLLGVPIGVWFGIGAGVLILGAAGWIASSYAKVLASGARVVRPL